MKNITLASLLLASLSLGVAFNAVADDDNENNDATTIIEQAVVNGSNLADVVKQTILANKDIAISLVEAAIGAAPEQADAILAAAVEALMALDEDDLGLSLDVLNAAIGALGADSDGISSLLTSATSAGIDADTVTGIAVAAGVDATLASQATAAGGAFATPGSGSNYRSFIRGRNGGGSGGGDCAISEQEDDECEDDDDDEEGDGE